MSRIVGGGEDTLAGVSYPPPPTQSRAQELLKKQLVVSYETDLQFLYKNALFFFNLRKSLSKI